jgi:hypothetical protein
MPSSKGGWNALPTRLIPAELSLWGDVGDSVLYHSLPGWQARNRFLGRLSDGDNFAQVNFSLNGIPTSLGVYEDSTHLLSLAKSR